jgi:hypothetical protein
MLGWMSSPAPPAPPHMDDPPPLDAPKRLGHVLCLMAQNADDHAAGRGQVATFAQAGPAGLLMIPAPVVMKWLESRHNSSQGSQFGRYCCHRLYSTADYLPWRCLFLEFAALMTGTSRSLASSACCRIAHEDDLSSWPPSEFDSCPRAGFRRAMFERSRCLELSFRLR